MAKSAKSKGGRASARSKGRGRRKSAAKGHGNGARNDAIAVLKADHREVEGLFKQFEKSRSDERKGEIAEKICAALKVHTTIEEEIFYPVFLEATDAKDLHHEAEVEHDSAKNLIAQIEKTRPSDEYYDAKVTVLKEMIKHHVKEEEQPGGLFAKARQSEMDLRDLGEKLKARKQELMGEDDEDSASRSQRAMAATLLGERNNAQRPGVHGR